MVSFWKFYNRAIGQFRFVAILNEVLGSSARSQMRRDNTASFLPQISSLAITASFCHGFELDPFALCRNVMSKLRSPCLAS
jgi:hypothetical protein